ncbi:lipopolysaccharide core biosynthesis protein RfaZ [Klebsiella pneumoniae subsp. ozaenae]|uniref:Lipopolysaccharide core biosynthesis protein RfaZ n=1 Tax=Klebsiella pneumoniae subsp. ozaenae TaxID=574 RepID=A0A377YY93_KLEPO|nr:lipopolysaccharide core biosynthesis protein RfaZ [Klebsiella pneumoniae subsp. ozaenae]
MGVNGAWHLADRLHFSLYTIVDMEFFDKKPDIIRAIVSQPDILLFTTMHGIAKSSIAMVTRCAAVWR